MGLFQSGDHIISGDDIYGGTNRLFSKVGTRFGLELSFVDCTDVSNIEKAIKPNTKVNKHRNVVCLTTLICTFTQLVWIETPTNPTMKISDIQAVSKITKKHNLILAVDNTFLTSYLQKPIKLGADLSVYSLTKYMNGHSDVIMGAIMTDNRELYEKLQFLQNGNSKIKIMLQLGFI